MYCVFSPKHDTLQGGHCQSYYPSKGNSSGNGRTDSDFVCLACRLSKILDWCLTQLPATKKILKTVPTVFKQKVMPCRAMDSHQQPSFGTWYTTPSPQLRWLKWQTCHFPLQCEVLVRACGRQRLWLKWKWVKSQVKLVDLNPHQHWETCSESFPNVRILICFLGWDTDMSSILFLVHLLPPSAQGHNKQGKM